MLCVSSDGADFFALRKKMVGYDFSSIATCSKNDKHRNLH
jgi:hypothetical protein